MIREDLIRVTFPPEAVEMQWLPKINSMSTTLQSVITERQIQSSKFKI